MRGCVLLVGMQRVGVVGGGLSGLVAAIAAAGSGAEVFVLNRGEPLGGRTAPVESVEEMVADRAPLAWPLQGSFDKMLRRIRTAMPSAQVSGSAIATVRGGRRSTLPHKPNAVQGLARADAEAWASVLSGARKGSLPPLIELREQIPVHICDALEAFQVLRTLDDAGCSDGVELSNSIITMWWKSRPSIALDGWSGASARLITSCLHTDVSFLTDGPVTSLRVSNEGKVDGVKRKGRVLPVDTVVLAVPADERNRILKSSGLQGELSLSNSTTRRAHARILLLGGEMMRPHQILWDSERRVLAIDVSGAAPMRIAESMRGVGCLLHLVALPLAGESDVSSEQGDSRIDALLDEQCSGWRGATIEAISVPELLLSAAGDDVSFDALASHGVWFAGDGISCSDATSTAPADRANETGLAAGEAAAKARKN
jgi:hypothetical protein